MANNKSIQLLRGNANAITNNADLVLLDGQPLYDKVNHNLYIGDGTTTLANLNTVNYIKTDMSLGTVAICNNAIASGNYAIALGDSATASAPRATALGISTTASGNWATAIGDSAEALGDSATALGDSAVASNMGATALGDHASASEGATALGSGATASSWNATALGNGATANSISTIAVGDSASATNTNAISIGAYANAWSNDSIAIGGNSVAGSSLPGALAIGHNAYAYGCAAAIGVDTKAVGMMSVAIGPGATVNSNEGSTIALGNSSISMKLKYGNRDISKLYGNPTSSLSVPYTAGVLGSSQKLWISTNVNFSNANAIFGIASRQIHLFSSATNDIILNAYILYFGNKVIDAYLEVVQDDKDLFSSYDTVITNSMVNFTTNTYGLMGSVSINTYNSTVPTGFMITKLSTQN